MQSEQMEQVAQRAYAWAQARSAPRDPGEHVSLGRPLRVVVFLVAFGIGLILSILVGGIALGVAGGAGAAAVGAPLGLVLGIPLSLVLAFWVSHIPRVAAQWERGVVLRFGRFHGIKGPGILLVFPVMDHIQFIDTRLLTLEIPHQQVITRDNVPVTIDGVIFFMVQSAERVVVAVQDYRYATRQYAQASLRDVVGSMTLDELLSERDQIQSRIAQVVEEHAKAWGIHVDSIRLLDINMPEDLKRMMSRQASAEREKRATITKAEGDKEAAINLAAAASTMATSPGAMQLRTLQTLDGLGASPSNTVVMAVPVEILALVRELSAKLRGAPIRENP